MGFAEMGICMEHVDVLKPTTKFTLAMLADRADPFMDSEKTRKRTDGRVECWPSIADLMHRTNQSKSTILRQLRELESLGIITVEKRWRRDDLGRPRQTSNRYILNLPEMLAGQFRKETTPLGVKMTPKESYPQSAGHAMGVKKTPIGAMGVKKGDSLGVTDDTPINYQELTTNPSPQPPTDTNYEAIVESSQGPSVGDRPAGRSGKGEDSSQNLNNLPAETTVNRQSTPQADLSGLKTSSESQSVNHAPRQSQEPPGSEDGGIYADAALVGAVLPEEMYTISPKDVPKIANAIRQRLDRGWSVDQLKAGLKARCLPSRVGNMTALVLARFRDDLPLEGHPLAHVGSTEKQPLTTADGRVVKHHEIDWGQVAIAHHKAVKTRATHASSRQDFLREVGVEHFLI